MNKELKISNWVSWGIVALFGLVMVLVVPSMVGAQRPEAPKTPVKLVGKFNKTLPSNYRIIVDGRVVATGGTKEMTATEGERWVLQRFMGGKWSDTKKSGTVALPRPKFMDDLLGEPKEGEEGYEPDVDGDVILPPEISDDDRDDALNRLRGKASVEFVEPDIQ